MHKVELTKEEEEIVRKAIARYLGKKDNPLNGKTFKEILEYEKKPE